jgi:hypothetical protein
MAQTSSLPVGFNDRLGVLPLAAGVSMVGSAIGRLIRHGDPRSFISTLRRNNGEGISTRLISGYREALADAPPTGCSIGEHGESCSKLASLAVGSMEGARGPIKTLRAIGTVGLKHLEAGRVGGPYSDGDPTLVRSVLACLCHNAFCK